MSVSVVLYKYIFRNTINGCKIKSSSVIASLNVNVYHTHDH